MMPQTTSFGLSVLCISARGSRGTSARQPARKARWVSLGLALTINYDHALLFERSEEGMKAKINAQTKSGTTALHAACEAGREELARFLHERGADPSIEDDDGKTAAVMAKAAGLKKDIFSAGRKKSIVDDGGAKKAKRGFFNRRGSKADQVTL